MAEQLQSSEALIGYHGSAVNYSKYIALAAVLCILVIGGIVTFS